jgi:glycerol-3-phosphate dehydrogenase (NAD(P)+)
MQKIAVLGSGSWGTALAIHLVRNKHDVTLWGRNAEQIELMKKQHMNAHFLPGIPLPDALHLSDQLLDTVKEADTILVAVPSHAFKELLEKIKPVWNSQKKIIWASKGLDPDSGDFLHNVADNILGNNAKTAVLSGPSFAKEVAQGLPAALTVATKENDEETALFFQELFHSDKFRIYISHDLVGVAICGSAKNILAIASGIAEGLSLGSNARAALITRGVAEITRLTDKLGGKRETLMGLAGLGDLILTCTGVQSRNYRFGVALGQGLSIADSLKSIDQVVEGINTSILIQQLAHQYNVEMPIVEQIVAVLNHTKTPGAAMVELLSRRPTHE